MVEFNNEPLYSYANLDGSRATNVDFSYESDFNEGLAVVKVVNFGYGYINEKAKFEIPPIYSYAECFVNGFANVKINGNNIIDKTGKQILDESHKFCNIGNFSDRLCRVSSLDISYEDLAYFTENESLVGCWGYIDEAGKEVISPKYIYATDFKNNCAIVCKGEWTKNGKWSNSKVQEKYWTDTELWGVIDKNGNEIIPCQFDEISSLLNSDGLFLAHIGGWKNGKYGIMNNKGEWVLPAYENISCEIFGFFKVSENKNGVSYFGLINADNQMILPLNFTSIELYDDGLIIATNKKEAQIIRVERY